MRHLRQEPRSGGAAEPLDRLEGDVALGEACAGAQELLVARQFIEMRISILEPFRDRSRRRPNDRLDVFPGLCLGPCVPALAILHCVSQTLLRAAAEFEKHEGAFASRARGLAAVPPAKSGFR